MREPIEHTRSIARQDWPAFFQAFTRMHAGWLCTMEVLGPSLGAQIETRGLRFAGASADVRHGEPTIHLSMGDGDARVTHAITSPRRVRVARTASGADDTIEIDAEGLTTLLRFRVAALPEHVNGYVD